MEFSRQEILECSGLVIPSPEDIPDPGIEFTFLACPELAGRRFTPCTTWWKVKVKLLSRVRLFAIPWTVVYQASQSMRFFQARVLEWVTISFSRGSSWPRDRTQVSSGAGRGFTLWDTWYVCLNLGEGRCRIYKFYNSLSNPYIH